MNVASASSPRRASRRGTTALLALALLGVIALAVWLLTQNTSPVVTQTRSLPAFTSVELAGSNLVTVQVGARQSVDVRARRNMLGRVTTQVRAGTLVIGNITSRGPGKGPMSVSVSVPSLTSLSISAGGSGMITATGVETPAFTVEVAGSGLVRAIGAVTRIDATVSGSGDAELGRLVARDATAVVSGSGRVVVNATGRLDASVPGAGLIQYLGNPRHVSSSVTGSGVVLPG